MESKFTIYKVSNSINSKLYIGQTVQKLEKRWKTHQSKGNALYNSIKKYGVEKFIIEAIDFAETIEELNEKEIYWIQFYNCISPNGYNLRLGGNSGGKHSEETKRKISEAGKGRPVSEKTRQLKKEQMSGEKNPMYGKSPNWGKECKPETRKKISESQIGKIISDETKAKISKACTGRESWRKGKKLGRESNRKNQFEFKVYREDGTFVGKWNHQRQCAEDLGLCYKAINNVLGRLNPVYKGYVFKKCKKEELNV